MEALEAEMWVFEFIYLKQYDVTPPPLYRHQKCDVIVPCSQLLLDRFWIQLHQNNWDEKFVHN